MTVFMVVSADEFELPVMVADSVLPIAKMFNTSKDCIHIAINRQHVREAKYRIIRVNIEED